MKKLYALFGLFVVGLVAVPSTVDAAALTCIAAPKPSPLAFPPVPVVHVLSWLGVGPCVGPGAASTFISVTPPCPAPPFVGPLAGEYCGPVIPPGGVAFCDWIPGPSPIPTKVMLFAGYDADFDGNIFLASGETPVFGPMAPLPLSWVVPNPYPFPARVIAYPTNLLFPGPIPGLTNFVICV